MITNKARVELDAKVSGAEQVRDATSAFSSLEKHLGSTGKEMFKANLASEALMKGLSILKDNIGGLIDTARTWNDWIGNNAAALDGMQRASDGIIGKLDLVRAHTKLATGDFKASEAQMQALAKAAVLYSRVVKVDLRAAMDKLADSAVLGRDKPLRQLGVDVELLGDASSRTEKFLKVLEDRFGNMTIKADNVNERIQKLEAAWTDMTGAVGHAVLSTNLFSDALGGVSTVVQALTGDIAAMARMVRSYAVDLLPLMGLGDSSVQKALIQASKYYERLAQGQKKGGGAGAWVSSNLPATADLMEAGPKRGKGRGGVSVPDLKAGIGDAGMTAQGAQMQKNAILQRQIQLQMEMNNLKVDEAARTQAAAESMNYWTAAASNLYKEQVTLIQQTAQMDAMLNNLAVGGVANLAGGLFAAADAAIQGKISFGEAMASMVKSTLLGVARESAVLALKYTAVGFGMQAATVGVPNPGSISAFTAAGIFAGLAAGTGAAGLGISAAMSGGGSKKPASRAGAGGSSSTYRPAFKADRSREEMQPIQIDIYWGDKHNRAVARQMTKQLEAEVRRVTT